MSEGERRRGEGEREGERREQKTMTILKNSIHLLISFLRSFVDALSFVRSISSSFLSRFFTLIISSLRHHVLQLFKIITSLQPFRSPLSIFSLLLNLLSSRLSIVICSIASNFSFLFLPLFLHLLSLFFQE